VRRASWLAAVILVVASGGGRAQRAVDPLGDLPLTYVPAHGAPGSRLAIILTGDGGWATIDREIADTLAAHAIPVVGFDSRHYFETQRTPVAASADLARVLRHYLAILPAKKIVFIGYSRGADTGPFMLSRLPAELRGAVELVALLGTARNANFKFHAMDLITNRHRGDDLMTIPEIQSLAPTPVLCIYGEDEKDSACRSLGPPAATVVAMPGGHHFDGRFGEVASRILAMLH
jgi:type IV secretory pathway VirJ component